MKTTHKSNHDGIPQVIQRALGTNYLPQTTPQATPQNPQDRTIRGLRGFLLPVYLSMRCGGVPRPLCRAQQSRERKVRTTSEGVKTRTRKRKRGSRGKICKTGGDVPVKLAAFSSLCDTVVEGNSHSKPRRRKRKRKKGSVDKKEEEEAINDKDWVHYQMMARVVIAPYTTYLMEIMNELACAHPSNGCERSNKKAKLSMDLKEDAVERTGIQAAKTADTSTAAVTADTSIASGTTSTIRNVYLQRKQNAHPPKSTNDTITLSSPRESLESLVDGVVCTLVRRTHGLHNTLSCSTTGPRKRWHVGKPGIRPVPRRRTRKKRPPSTIPDGTTNTTSKPTNIHHGSSVNDWLRQKNILSAGYSLGSGETFASYRTPSFLSAKRLQHNPLLRACPNMAPGVHCLQPNSLTTFARSSGLMRTWHALVGDEVLAEILLNAVVLIPAVEEDEACGDRWDGSSDVFGKGNYFQLCGPPLNVVAKQFEKMHANAVGNTGVGRSCLDQACADGSGKSEKRKRDSANDDRMPPSNAKRHSHQKMEWNPNKSIPRYKLFYCEFYARRVGFSPRHVLNQTGSGDAMSVKERKISCNTEGAVDSSKHEINLLDDIVQLWPTRSEHFDPNFNGGSIVYNSKRRARWRRLRENGVKMCREIIRRHRQCDYERLLEKNCPLLVNKDEPWVKKKENEFHSKVELSCLVTLFTPSEAVGKFLEAVLSKAFPNAFWGSKHNFCQVIKTLKVFLNLRLTESFPEKSIVEGIRILDMTWLHPPCNFGRKKAKISRSGHESCVVLLRNVMRWIYRQYITPLLRSTFYITDTEFTGRRVLYYRRPIWTRIRSLSLDILLKRQYRERILVKAQKVLSSHNVGCPPAPLRLLPKKTGIRAIAMLSKSCTIEEHTVNGTQVAAKLTKQRSLLPPNMILQSTFHALKYEYKKRSSLFGAGALGVTELFRPYCLFLDALRRKYSQFSSSAQKKDASSTTNDPKISHKFQLYFTSADIQHCYDTINQEHLYKQVRSVLQEDCYVTQNHFILHSMRGRQSSTRCRWQRTTCSPDKVVDIVSKSKTLSGKFRNSIFIDGVNCSVEKRRTILGLLKDHIFGQIIVAKGHCGQRLLLQRNGIPQGSILSSLFCNAYFGNVEDLMFDGIFDDDSIVIMGSNTHQNALLLESPSALHLLFRIVDDFLLISTDLETSRRFLKRLNRGVPRLGVKVNPDKTRVNYNVSLENQHMNITQIASPNKDSNMFPWCGLLINMETCEIFLDRDRLSRSLATDNVTVHRSGNEGLALFRKMQDFVKPRCHQQLLFSSFINSPDTIRMNFYQTFMLCATKTMYYLKSGNSNICPSRGTYVYSAVCDTIHYAYTMISSSTQDSSIDDLRNDSAYKLTLREALWLGKRAFYSVITKESGLRHLRSLFCELRSEPVYNRRDLVFVSKRGLNSWPLID